MHLLGVEELAVAKETQRGVDGGRAVHHNGQVKPLPLAYVGRGLERLEQHLDRRAVLPWRPYGIAQRDVGQLDAKRGGQLGLLQGVAQVLAPVRKQHQAPGPLVGKEGQPQLQRAGDVGARGDGHGGQIGQEPYHRTPAARPAHPGQRRRPQHGLPRGMSCTAWRITSSPRACSSGERLSDASRSQTAVRKSDLRLSCMPGQGQDEQQQQQTAQDQAQPEAILGVRFWILD